MGVRQRLCVMLSGCLLAILMAGFLLPSQTLANEEETTGGGVPDAYATVKRLLPPVPFGRPSLSVPLASLQRRDKSDEQTFQVRGRLPDFDLNGSPAVAAAQARGEKWIVVDLGSQLVYVYEGAEQVNRFLVSTGVPGTPTVTGEFRIWMRTPLQDMSGGSRAAGDYYYLEDVPWVQYFYESYGFHGTYWHNNYGTPMSRGCVNMTIEDAKWLFDWAYEDWEGEQGWLQPTEENATLVIVHQ